MNTVTPLVPRHAFADAAAHLEATKAAEAAATRARHGAEKALLDLIADLPDEGTTRHDAGQYMVIVTSAMRRTVDGAKLAAIADQIPEAIGQRLIRWKPELVTRELRYIESNEPEIYRTVAQAITAKPAKPSIKVEPVKPGPEAA